jgi:predicted enzyme related to lactoylglutathione lyase
MLTAQPADACTFFGSLLGWSFGEIPGMGYSIKVAGTDVGGLFDLNGPNTPPGTRPVIGVMVKVESADAAVKQVEALGGKAMPAFDIMDRGRMAVCFGPDGANFDVWESRKGEGMEVDSGAHGAPSWFENLTSDAPRAARFYSELFGWKAEAMPMPDFTYTSFKRGEEWVAGMMPILPRMGEMKPEWSVYFTVKDVDAAARDAAKLGGSVTLAPHDIPDVGRLAGIASPRGVTFYVIKYAT